MKGFKNPKKKVIVFLSIALVLLAAVVAVSYAVYRSTSKEEIVYETGSVKIKYTGGVTLNFKNLKAGDEVKGENGTPLISMTNSSSVPTKVTFTLTLTNPDGSAITDATRKAKIESLLGSPTSPFVKDNAASVDNLLVYTANNIEAKGTAASNDYVLFNAVTFPSDFTQDDLDAVGDFNLGVEATATQQMTDSSTGSYEYLISSTENLLPGAYQENVGAVTYDDSENNTMQRPVMLRTRVTAKATYADEDGRVVTEDMPITNDTFILNTNSNWTYINGYYYFKAIYNTNAYPTGFSCQGCSNSNGYNTTYGYAADVTAPLFDKIKLSEGLDNKYQGAQIKLSFENEFIDSDPDVRPEEWPTDQEIGITDNPGTVTITVSCPTEYVQKGETFRFTMAVNGNAWSSLSCFSGNIQVVPHAGGPDMQGFYTGGTAAVGTATVTCYTEGYVHSGSCTINVEDHNIHPETVTVTPEEQTIMVGETTTLTAGYTPQNVTNVSYIWEALDCYGDGDDGNCGHNAVAGIIGDDTGDTIRVVGITPGDYYIQGCIDGVCNYKNHYDMEMGQMVKYGTPAVVHVVANTCEPVTNMSLSDTDITATTGDTGRIVAVAETTATSQPTFTYQSSDPSIVSVDQAGNYTAHTTGKATIIVSACNRVLTANITVNPSINPTTGLSVNPSSATLDIAQGDTVTLVPTRTCQNEEEVCTDSIVFTSDNTSIAMVDSATGFVVPVSVGTTTIAVRSGDNVVRVTVTVTNSNLDKIVNSITATPEINLEVGQSETVQYTIDPANTQATITFASLDSSIATVDSNGLVVGTGNGSTYAIISAGGKMAAVKVNVFTRTTSISINEDDFTLDISKSETKKLTATVNPSGSTQDVVWTSSDPEVAIVDASTGRVIGVSVGTATITATSGNKSDTVTVTVVDNGGSSEPAVEVTLTVDETPISINVGDIHDIIASVDPEGTEIKYVSTDSSIVKVDKNGKITGVAGGKAVIVVSAGGVTKMITVTVVDPNAGKIDYNGTNKNWVPNPKTGDNIWLYVGIAVVSVCIILVLLFVFKLNKKNRKRVN